MATHHGGTGQPLANDPQPQESNFIPPHDYPEEADNLEQDEHTQLKDLTNAVDNLQHHFDTSNHEPREAINHLECELHRLTLTLHPSAPPESFDDLSQQYTATLCSAQQKTTFTNNMLQDITIFTGTDSSQLEDWLTDIETEADLMLESHTKLAQAKSKGLTHTLISEALSSDKSWDKIKDLLRLKLCNLDIHMSVSLFMEIQQKDKESLAAYIHRFKREAQ